MRKARADKEKSEIAELITLQANHLKQIEERFADIGSSADIGERIVKLEKLKSDIRDADFDVRSRLWNIAKRRVKRSPRTWWNPDAHGQKTRKAQAVLLEQNPALRDFEETLEAQRKHAGKMLDQTLKTCDLLVLSDSPFYEQLHGQYEQLSKRFAAAADRQALKCKAAAHDVASKPIRRM